MAFNRPQAGRILIDDRDLADLRLREQIAAAIIGEALRLQPGNPESLQIAGSVALLAGQFAVACDYLGQAHALAPQARHILANYLEALLRAGNPALAQGLAAAAGQDFPDWLPGKVFLARAWAAQAAWPPSSPR